jgi:transposase-like protein
VKRSSLIESGKFCTHSAAREAYGITGMATIRNWLKKYGRIHLLTRVVKVETETDRDQIKDLKKEIAQLKRAIADSKVQEVIHKAAFEVVCEEYGLGSPDEVKKNSMFSNRQILGFER